MHFTAKSLLEVEASRQWNMAHDHQTTQLIEDPGLTWKTSMKHWGEAKCKQDTMTNTTNLLPNIQTQTGIHEQNIEHCFYWWCWEAQIYQCSVHEHVLKEKLQK
jgi:hypothetical protein